MLRAACLLVVVAACGSVKQPSRDDSGPPPTPSREIVSGAGRLTSATFTLDVEIGHQVSQQSAAGATHNVEGNAAVKP